MSVFIILHCCVDGLALFQYVENRDIHITNYYFLEFIQAYMSTI